MTFFDPDYPYSPDPWLDPAGAGGVERDWSGVPIRTSEIETATWCTKRNGYADEEFCGEGNEHTHYDVQYNVVTGRVLTGPAEQERRRLAAESDRRLWHEVTYALLHARLGPIYKSAEFLREHPAMQELLRREREKGTTHAD